MVTKTTHRTPEATVTTIQAARLTDHERRVIADARQLAGLHGTDALSAHTGTTNPDLVYPVAFGQAAWLLGEVAAIAERLGGAG